MVLAALVGALDGGHADAEDLLLEVAAHAADEGVGDGGDAQIDGFHEHTGGVFAGVGLGGAGKGEEGEEGCGWELHFDVGWWWFFFLWWIG